MSLDNIKLNPELVQQLYRKSLVEIEKSSPIPPITEKQPVSFLGKNEKHIVVVVDEKDHAFLSETDLELLVGILTACNLTIADVAIINMHGNNGFNYEGLLAKFSPAIVLLFGVEAEEMEFPLHFPPYKLQQHGRHTYLSSASLNTLATDTEQKKKLWPCLQQYFLQK